MIISFTFYYRISDFCKQNDLVSSEIIGEAFPNLNKQEIAAVINSLLKKVTNYL